MAIDYSRPRKPSVPAEPGQAGSGINFSRAGRATTPAPVTPASPIPPAPPTAPSPTPPAASAPPRPPVSLSKVTLTTSAPTISLTKSGQSQGVMRVNLNWTSKAPGKGFMAKIAGTDAIDLDLGCLYELSDGRKGGIQALGNSFGSLQSPPYILLDGDDRSGANVGGENLLINLDQPARFRRILIFAMIYQGATRWADANGVVTLFPTAGPQVEVRLDGTDTVSRICGIALLENRGGELVVQREVRYVQGSQRKLDELYGWGLKWAPGSK